MTRQVPVTPSTRAWLARTLTAEELEQWGPTTIHAIAQLIDNLEGPDTQ